MDRPVPPTNSVRRSLETLVELHEGPRDHFEGSGHARLVTRPATVSMARVAQQYARATAVIGTDQFWTALRPWGEGAIAVL